MLSDFEATIFRTLAQIAERERLKAINKDDYGTAFFVSILKGIFRDAEKDASGD